MQVSWLHVSDFHIRGGDPYDRDVVLKTLVKSVRYFRDHGRAPDLIFATGDIAHGGKPAALKQEPGVRPQRHAKRKGNSLHSHPTDR